MSPIDFHKFHVLHSALMERKFSAKPSTAAPFALDYYYLMILTFWLRSLYDFISSYIET